MEKKRHDPNVTKLRGLLRFWQIFRHPFGAFVLRGTLFPQSVPFVAEFWSMSAAGPGGDHWLDRQFAFTDKGRVKLDMATMDGWEL